MTPNTRQLLIHAGCNRVSILTAAYELDPDGKEFGIQDVVEAIDAKLAIPIRRAGDNDWAKLAAALEGK